MMSTDVAAETLKRRIEHQKAVKYKKSTPSTIPSLAAQTSPHDDDAAKSPLSQNQTTELHESYTEDESFLDTFQRLHPMLSFESMSQRALQLASNLIPKTEIPTVDIPSVTKSYDDDFLRPPNINMQERSCCLGDKCIGRWLAIFRYGEENNKGFICREYLLPKQNELFLRSKVLPAQPSKCLLCMCAK